METSRSTEGSLGLGLMSTMISDVDSLAPGQQHDSILRKAPPRIAAQPGEDVADWGCRVRTSLREVVQSCTGILFVDSMVFAAFCRHASGCIHPEGSRPVSEDELDESSAAYCCRLLSATGEGRCVSEHPQQHNVMQCNAQPKK